MEKDASEVKAAEMLELKALEHIVEGLTAIQIGLPKLIRGVSYYLVEWVDGIQKARYEAREQAAWERFVCAAGSGTQTASDVLHSAGLWADTRRRLWPRPAKPVISFDELKEEPK